MHRLGLLPYIMLDMDNQEEDIGHMLLINNTTQ
jgi:hypothetical protein